MMVLANSGLLMVLQPFLARQIAKADPGGGHRGHVPPL